MAGIIGVVLVVLVLGGMLVAALRAAPMCVCGKQECGGGCIHREG